MRLEELESGEAPERQLARVGCNSEPPEIVYNPPEIGVAVSVHLYPLGSWMARPSTVMPDLMMLQCVAEQAFSPASHAGRLEKWQKWQFLGSFSSICTLM
jgi:hypothetical protein